MVQENKVSKIKERLEKEFHQIWLSEPAEVRRIKEDKKIAGAFEQKGSILLYTTNETGGIVIYLYYLRSMAKTEEVDIKALRIVTANIVESKANQWRRYYSMDETPSLMEEAALALRVVENKEDLLGIIDGLMLYLGKFNFWLDSTIPWASICSMIDWHLEKS